MSFTPTHRVGLITPSANPAFEPELRALLPSAVAVHATRLPVMPGSTLADRNARYPDAYRDALRAFGDLALNVQTVGLTGPSYALSPADDEAFQADLSAHAGSPVVLPSRAIAAALAALGHPRTVLFSPYPGWLTDRAEAYWRGAGLDVAEVFKVSETFRAYELTTDEILAALRRLGPAPGTAVVMSGTGMQVLDAMETFGADSRAVLLPSNVAVAFAILRTLGLPGSDAFLRLAPALASAL